MPAEDAMLKSQALYAGEFASGKHEWPAIMRKWRKAKGVPEVIEADPVRTLMPSPSLATVHEYN